MFNKSTKRDDTKGKYKIYQTDGPKGFKAAKKDFDSLDLHDVFERTRLDGNKTYTGKTPEGKIVDFHKSTIENEKAWTMVYGKIKIRY